MALLKPPSEVETSQMLSVLRIVAGAVFFTSGTMKLFGFPPMPAGQPPLELMSEVGVAGILETFGGAAIVLGLFTRSISFILAGEMAVAYFQFAFPVSFWPTSNQGIPAILYCFLFLYFVFSGAGVWSLDARIARSKAESAARQPQDTA